MRVPAEERSWKRRLGLCSARLQAGIGLATRCRPKGGRYTAWPWTNVPDEKEPGAGMQDLWFEPF